MHGSTTLGEMVAGEAKVAARRRGRRERGPARSGAAPAALGRADVSSSSSLAASSADLLEYQRALWERSVLFWDTLRRHADDMLEHERLGLPPLLDFRPEMVLDARSFLRPTNYALLRILGHADTAEEVMPDPRKPPVMVVDPRAGHGPGIGGFKRESEVGMALAEGHPVYFVVFFPEPCHRRDRREPVHQQPGRAGGVPYLQGLPRGAVALVASEADHHRAGPGNTFVAQETAFADTVLGVVEVARAFRDVAAEHGFATLYSPVVKTERAVSSQGANL